MKLGPFAQVLTLEGLPESGPISDNALKVYENAGIEITNGIISYIGPMEGAPQNAVAMPGLIDAHTHLCFAGIRAKDYAARLSGATYQEIAAKGGGILDSVRKTREATEQELTQLTLERLKRAFSNGITTCEVKSGYGLSVEQELKLLQAIVAAGKLLQITVVPTCLAAHTLPPEFDSHNAYLVYLVDKLLPQARQLCSRVDIFVEKGAFGVVEAEKYLLAAKELGFEICIHADQFSRGGALLAAKVGATSADHLEQSNDEDFAALKLAGVIPVILPGATLGLGMPFPPARKILDAGLPLAIASDWNPGSAPMGDLLTQAAVLGAAQKLTMAETLAGITFRAAKALRLHDRGILAKGMRADIAIFPGADYREILYYQGSLKPSITIANGVVPDVT
ncbi:MAG: imidazolonepropionase [Chlamydiales bacterium]|nr:imidazolonepropionase [Chlamydiales bacterium]